jgi:hypothetical protein
MKLINKIVAYKKLLFSPYRRWYNYHFGYYEYYNIPFEFPKPQHSSAPEVLKKGCDILNEIGVKHCVSFGTLLGIYRNNSLIPHDSDLDIDALLPVNARRIEKEFIKNGFKLGCKVIALGKVQKLAFYSENEVVFDIEFYEKIGDFVYSFHESSLYFKFPFEFYEKFEKHKFLNYMVYVPNHVENWLEFAYGKDWRIPKSSKRDFREDNFFDKEGYGMHVKCEGNIIDEIKKLHNEL